MELLKEQTYMTAVNIPSGEHDHDRRRSPAKRKRVRWGARGLEASGTCRQRSRMAGFKDS
ncbi:hypothetical protein [Frondihabitans sp. PhB188]|uniref:hypothetical protein n=1 Tax=Frondihabitans sp. PhB188 TaxID=2485200 RepID=UPI0011CEA516|nr:hypothetical protein [Frondihabitans sp. PhB188]